MYHFISTPRKRDQEENSRSMNEEENLVCNAAVKQVQ